MKQPEIRVLIVEDNPGDLVLARKMLDSIEAAEFSLVHASTLSAALSELKQPFDLVLLDLNLPDSQELETLRRVRREASTVPILVLTGIADREKGVAALSEGAQDYLVKGKVDSHLLEKAIFRHVLIRELKNPAS